MPCRAMAIAALASVIWLTTMSSPAQAQLGALISPGPLAKAHANLEGISKCQQCHERGRRVIAEKCLACHAPVADRMTRRIGVHKDVKGDCVTCHVEHAGVDAELRPFDQKGFDHGTVTGFAIDGKHAPLATQCSACHKTRSFISLKTACASCHTDVHKGRFGQSCSSCHSTRAAFKDFGGQFDHTKAAFQLAGAHQKVACASCHVNKTYKGLKFASCTDCHTSPHRPIGVVAASTRQTPGFGTACTTCHTNDSWRTKKINHDQTAFPLVGGHTTVECASCHRQPAMKVKPKADSCAACHVDVHRGTFKQDCRSCHTETSFKKAPFDHTRTQFALTGKHQAVACNACHKNAAPSPAAVARGATGRPVPASGRGVPAAGRGATSPRPGPAAPAVTDFRGLQTACVSCHADVHRAELGSTCESCHSTTTFKQQNYVHRRVADFFGGQHATVACAKCHVPAPPTRPVRTDAQVVLASFKSTTATCVSCHRDVHLGQEGAACEQCHTVSTAKFAVENVVHTQFRFALTGKHTQVACASCHKVETGTFPAGTGTATRLKGVSHECRACHADVHLGQLAGACEACHTTDTFHFTNYTHRNRSLASFFVGRHRTECAACHKPTTGQFPAGTGTAIKFQVDTRCVACHEDIHRGSLGKNCATCHRP